MKINKQKPKKYKLYIAIIILFVLIAGAIYYSLNILNNKKDNPTNNSPTSVKEESQPKKQERAQDAHRQEDNHRHGQQEVLILAAQYDVLQRCLPNHP